jgi:hypothetical protein
VCFVLRPCLSWGCSGSGALYADDRAAHWVRCAAALVSLFPYSPWGSITDRLPRSYGLGFILPCRYSPSEFLRSFTRPETFVPEHICLGFVPHRDITGGIHYPQQAPSFCYVPSSGFRNLSTVCSATGSPGLFHPERHVQGSLPVQGILSPHGDLPSSGRLTSVLVHSPTADRFAPAATAARASYEALLRAEQRSRRYVG